MLNPILILLAAIVLEVLAWIGAAQFVSGWWIFLWTAIAFVWGLSILRGRALRLRETRDQRTREQRCYSSQPSCCQIHSSLL